VALVRRAQRRDADYWVCASTAIGPHSPAEIWDNRGHEKGTIKITGPERYRLSTNSESFTVAERFSKLAGSRLPKLYIAAVNDWPIYVGTTRQPMRSRLRYGFQAK
jgi:hypothetical protein